MVKRLFIATFVAISPLLAAGQGLITGHITDVRTGEPLIGASVIVKSDKGLGVVTDIDGNFALQTAVEAPLTLKVEYIGYRPLEVDVYDFEEPVEIHLIDNSNSLDEVVVVGYGTQKRKSLTGAVATVKADELLQASTSFDNALGGAVAGLAATSSSGQPGAAVNIRIRGGNSINGGNEPLYVIDGVLIYNSSDATNTGNTLATSNFNPLASINPADIESIEVLKDVSASAIYGSRGANGVIIVTTKKGKRGNVKVDYGYSVGIASVRKKLDVLDAQQWGELYLELATDAQKAATGVTPEVVASWGKGTDWQDALFHTAVTQQHQVSVSGGSERERFLISGNYTDQDGVVRGTDFSRIGARLNYERDIFKNVTVGLNANLSKSTQKGAYNFQNSSKANGFSGLLELAVRTSPAVPIYNADGSFNYTNPFEQGDFVRNGLTPNAIADLSQVQKETKVDNTLLSAFISWEIVNGLRFRTQGSANIVNTRQNFFGPATSQAGFDSDGYGSIGSKRWESDQFEATLTWNKAWKGIHELEVLGGYTYQQEKGERFFGVATGFANENLGYHSLQSGSQLVTLSSRFVTSSLYSGIGRVNYSLLDRYHLTATLRADGSSRFAKNHKWGWFPSLGFAWNVNEERWFKGKKWIEDLKLRASIGSVGNQEIGDYQFLATYAATHYFFGGAKNTAYYRSLLPNDDLKWETTTSYDLGFDLSTLKGRLGFVFDVYHKKTSDLLISIPVEETTGFSEQLSNVGNVTNTGVELAVKAIPIQSKKLQWILSGNIAHNKNKVTSIGAGQHVIINGNTIIRVGEPLGSYYGWVFDGVVQAGDDLGKVPAPSNKPTVEYGDAKFVDQNGDGVVDQESDRVLLGSTQPKFTYGLASTLRYGNWDLSLNFQGSYGNKLYNQMEQTLETPSASYNVSTKLLDRWTAENTSTTIPRAYSSTSYGAYLDSRFVEGASYLRLKNIQVGYAFKPRLNNGTKLGVYLYASAQNLLTFTGYSGFDPEYSGATDRGTYPSARTFTFGVKFSY